MNTNTYNAIAFKSSLELLKSVRMLMPLMLTILNLDDVCHAFIFYLYYNYIIIMVMEQNVLVYSYSISIRIGIPHQS